MAIPGAADGNPPGQGPPPATAAAGTRVTVALLCDESGSPEVEAAVADLSEALEADVGLTVLDRRHIRKVLAERSLSAAGLVREPVRQGQILGAAYLVYAAPGVDEFNRRHVSVLGIETASGNVISEQVIPVGGPRAEATRKAAAALAAHIRASAAETALGLPTAVVASSINKGASRRLEFLEGSLQGILEDLLKERGYRLLRRQRPDLLAGETTLGSSGLARPDAAVLAAVGDLVLSAAFSESPSLDKPFEETPIHLDLLMKVKGAEASTVQFTFTLATLKELVPQLRQAIPDRVHHTDGVRSADDDHLERRLEAARLLATLKDPSRHTPFMGVDVERRQVATAQRVIYLDPTAKEAHYHLARAMCSLIVQTDGWHTSKPSEGSWQEVVDAWETYLRFPRTDPAHVGEAFYYLVRCCLKHVCQGEELIDRSLVLLTEYYRWSHELEATRSPESRPGNFAPPWSEELNKYWEEHPDRQIRFYAWIDRLYEQQKKGLSVFPFQTARAYTRAGQRQKAAEYLYDGMVTQKPSDIHLNSYLINPEDYAWARELAAVLPPDRAAPILARLDRRQGRRKENEMAWGELGHGEAGTNSGGAHGYSYHADEIMLKRGVWPQVAGEPVPLPQNLVQTVMIRRTPIGLWVQGITAGGELVLCFSGEPNRWNVVDVPKPMARSTDDQQKVAQAIEIVQVGDDVLFATHVSGLFVYRPRDRSWRQFEMKDGLPADSIYAMTLAEDGRSAWITGGRFVYQYRDGSIFLAKARVTDYPSGLAFVGPRMFVLGYDPADLWSAATADGPVARVLDVRQQRRQTLVPDIFQPPPRDFNAGVYSNRRLLARGGKLYAVNKHGLQVMDAEGRPLRLWRPGGFFYWSELGIWVDGNCPLPPCQLMEVVPDDQRSELLWLASKHDDYITSYQMLFHKGIGVFEMDLSPDAAFFITAYDTRTETFSTPLRVTAPFSHFEPRGDDLYLTGKSFSRISKKQWVIDRPGQAEDALLQVSCPDQRLVEASLALCRGDFEQARRALDQAAGGDFPASRISAMKRSLDKLIADQAKAKSLPAQKNGGQAISPAP